MIPRGVYRWALSPEVVLESCATQQATDRAHGGDFTVLNVSPEVIRAVVYQVNQVTHMRAIHTQHLPSLGGCTWFAWMLSNTAVVESTLAEFVLS